MRDDQCIHDLGKRIRAAIGARERTQADLAEALGLTTKTMYLIVNGKTKDPSVSIVAGIAKELGVPIGFLTGETDDIPYNPDIEVVRRGKKRGRKPKVVG